ncbi:calpain-9-like isoform X2 [Tubulanus polymorphus]|uniref:calpain-9-like isoform X2 n=1 Tax=Tubulanus polymorphus TaxID=672921 RepID=UPI003DA1CC23
MSHSFSRTTRTTYTSGGPAGGRSTTTTTTYGDGRRTTTSDNNGYGGSGYNRPAYGGYGGGSRTVGYRSKYSTPSARSEYKPKPKPHVGARGFELGSQNYEEIVKQAQQDGALWEDPQFPADDRSIFFSKSPPRPFVWQRPGEIVNNPQLFVGGASRFDVKQGQLGDCWLLAAVASLSLHPALLARVVPHDQTFDRNKGYCGVFHFQFWQFGEWVDVIVDDRLPTYDGKLVFLHSAANNEFWTPLLEKAYAKLFGSYESLKGGSTSEAMEDFTGGVTEFFDFRKTNDIPKNLFQIMLKADSRSSLMACSIEADPNKVEAALANGLIMGHAYSVTGVKMIEVNTRSMSGKMPLVRVRNPWGNEAEWKGAWSDGSREWTCVSEAEKLQLGLTLEDDGEFWMSYQDFITNFQRLEICHLGPDAAEETDKHGQKKRRWEASMEAGSWRTPATAGGCRNFIKTFHTNPQYRVKVVDPDEDDDEDMGTLIVGLMQKGRRKKREEGLDMVTIGYAIYKLKSGTTGTLDMDFFKYNASAARSPSFINLREVCGRHKLTPGEYVIIPTTFEPNTDAEFILRIFTENPSETGEMDEETGMKEVKDSSDPNKEIESHKAKPGKELTPQEKAQNDQLRRAFESIAGEDMEIDCHELRDILNAAFMKEFNFDGFSRETCRSMIALMDVDQSGKLGFDEFNILWNDLRLWKTEFKRYDVDKSGTFSASELKDCLKKIGFILSNKTFWSVVIRYAGSKDGQITFDDFILACVRLKTMFETFDAMPKEDEKIQFKLDDFIKTCIYT